MKVSSWFFREDSNLILSAFRSILCLYLLFFHTTPSDFNLFGTSGGTYIPVGIFHILPQLTDQTLLQVLSHVFQASLFLAAFGILTGPSLLVAVVSGAYVLANHYNYGTVGHGTTLIYTCVLVLALVPWSAWKKDYVGIHARWPIAFLKCFIVATYFIAGLQKLRFSGFEWAWSENLAIYMFQHSSTLAGQILLELPAVVLRSFAAFALFVELLSPLALLSRRNGYVFVFLWASLHLGIQLTMGHHKGFLSQIPCLLVFCEGLLLFAGKHARLQWGRLVKIR